MCPINPGPLSNRPQSDDDNCSFAGCADDADGSVTFYDDRTFSYCPEHGPDALARFPGAESDDFKPNQSDD